MYVCLYVCTNWMSQICVAAKSLYNAIMGQTVFTHPHYVIPHLLRKEKSISKVPTNPYLA